MKVVINTNVMLVSLSSKSKYHWIFNSLKAEAFDLLVSNEILFEYEEIITRKYNAKVANLLLNTLESLPNINFIRPFFQWRLIIADVDDNKFSDCAIAGNADHLVTEDSDFDVLKKIQFPHLSVLNIREFQAVIKSQANVRRSDC